MPSARKRSFLMFWVDHLVSRMLFLRLRQQQQRFPNRKDPIRIRHRNRQNRLPFQWLYHRNLFRSAKQLDRPLRQWSAWYCPSPRRWMRWLHLSCLPRPFDAFWCVLINDRFAWISCYILGTWTVSLQCEFFGVFGARRNAWIFSRKITNYKQMVVLRYAIVDEHVNEMFFRRLCYSREYGKCVVFSVVFHRDF